MKQKVLYFLLCLNIGVLRCQNVDSLALASLQHEDSSLISVRPVSFNSPYPDFAPLVKNKKLFFVSGRPSTVGVKYTDLQNESEITDLYYANLQSPVKSRAVKALDGVNTRYYEGPFCFSITGDTIFYSGNDRKDGRLKIFSATIRNKKWSAPTPMSFCTDTFSYCHPSLSADGRRLYFSSNVLAKNKMDIYYAERTPDGWSGIVNAGQSVNSTANELFPFAGRHGHIYFASDREGGLGGLDIYNVRSDSPELPLLLYPPINSPADDFGIWTDTLALTGYFSSARNGSGKDNIFYYERSIPDFSRSESPPVKNRFCYSFYEETSLHNNDTAQLTYEWRFGDGESSRGLTTKHCYRKWGTYQVQLTVVDKSSGEVTTNLVSYDIEIPEPPMLKIDAPESGKVQDLIIFNGSGSSLKDFTILEKYWSFGDGFFNKGDFVAHKYRNAGKYVVQLWVLAKNDHTGREAKFVHTREISIDQLN